MKKLFTLLLTIVISSAAFAQYYYIPSTTVPGNPGTLNTTLEYPVGGGLDASWTTIHNGGSATPSWSAVQTIPIPFSFNGSPVTQYQVSSSGVLTFDVSAVTVPPSSNAVLPSANIPDKSVCVWGLSAPGTNDKIVHQTFGTAPNRQYWVFFTSYNFNGGGTSCWTYWSIVMEETTNKIYIVDQRNTTASGCMPALTLGIQINATTAVQVSGSPSIGSLTAADFTDADNYFYEFIYGVQPANETSLLSATVNNEAGQATLNSNNDVTGKLQNRGSQTLTQIDVSYSVDGGSAVTQTITGLNVASGAVYSFTHPTAYVPTTGGGTFRSFDIWTSNPNNLADPNTSNDSASTTVLINLGITGTKHVLLEEFTTAPCGFCPDGAVVVEDILTNYNNVIAVGVHAGFGTDAMTIPSASDYSSAFTTGAPTALIDRLFYEGQTNVAISRSIWEAKVAERLNEATPVNVGITGTYHETTRKLDVTVSANFVDYAVPGDFRINFYVIEDNLVGSGSGWDQVNYYNGTSGHPYYGAGDPIQGYVHKHVLRAVPSTSWGTSGIISNAPQPGNNFTKDYNNYTVNGTWNEEEMYLVAYVSYYNSDVKKRQVINSIEIPLMSLATGIKTAGNLENGIGTIYPNPVSDVATLLLEVTDNTKAIVDLFDIFGKKIRTVKNSTLAPGAHNVAIYVGDLSAGMYIAQITMNGQVSSQRIAVAR